MKAREIRARLRGKISEDFLVVLESLAEDIGVLRKQITMLTSTQDQLIDIVAQFVQIASNMKAATESITKMEGRDDLPTT